MPDGTGLKRFRNMYPERFFDVGIAEEHAVTFAAGTGSRRLYTGGGDLFLFFAESHMTRYSMMSVSRSCRWYLPVDRAGLVGSDGETHQGIFDLSLFVQHSQYAHDGAQEQMRSCHRYAEICRGGCGVRLPSVIPEGRRTRAGSEFRAPDVPWGRARWIYEEGGIALLAVGKYGENST